MDSNGVFVGNIPNKTTKQELRLTFLHQSECLYDISYILYPVDLDYSRAFIKFSKFPEKLFGARCEIKGQRITVTPAQADVYAVCSAVVDTLVAASIPDVRKFIEELKDEFGLRVEYNKPGQPLMLAGSLLQLQAAQMWLRDAFSRHRELQHTQLLRTMSSWSGKNEILEGVGGRSASSERGVDEYLHERDRSHLRPVDEYSTSTDARTHRRDPAADTGIPHEARGITQKHVHFTRLDAAAVDEPKLLQHHSITSSGRDPAKMLPNVSSKKSDHQNYGDHGRMEVAELHSPALDPRSRREDRTGAVGDRPAPKTVADLDYFVVEYLFKCKCSQVHSIESQFGVMIERVGRVCDEIVTIAFVQERVGSDFETKARDAFVNLVTETYAVIIQKEVRCRETVSEFDVSVYQKVLKEVFVASNDDYTILTVVGPFEVVTIAEELIKKEKRKSSGSDSMGSANAEGLDLDVHDEFRFTRDSGDMEMGGKKSVTIRIYTANIAQVSVDVIVNAGNCNLENWSGVAACIERAGGTQLRDDCRRIIARGGPLKPSEVAHSPGCGSLKCRHVIHTVGPIWTNRSDDEAMCTDLLLRTFQNVMYYASRKLNASTIAIPPIGAGTFGVPLDVCARSIHSAIEAIIRKVSDLSLREIHVVSYDPDTTAYIQTIFRQLLEQDFERGHAVGMSSLSGNPTARGNDGKSNFQVHRKPAANLDPGKPDQVHRKPADSGKPDEQSGDGGEVHRSQHDRRPTMESATGEVINERALVQQPTGTVSGIASTVAECDYEEEELADHNLHESEEIESAVLYSGGGPLSPDESRDPTSSGGANESLDGTSENGTTVKTKNSSDALKNEEIQVDDFVEE